MVHKETEQQNKNGRNKKSALFFGVIVGIIFLFIGSFAFYSSLYSQKIYPNVVVAGMDIGGLDKNSAKEKLNYRVNSNKNKDISLIYGDKSWIMSANDLLITYDIDQTISAAYQIGHNTSIVQSFLDRVQALSNRRKIKLAFSFNQKTIDNVCNDITNQLDKKEADATLYVQDNNVLIRPEQTGQKVQSDLLKRELLEILSEIKDSRTITIPIVQIEPQIKSDNIQLAKNQTEIIIGQKLVLDYVDAKKEISQADILNWVEFITYYNKTAGAYQLKVILNNEKIKNYVKQIAKDINHDPIDAELTIVDGRASVFAQSQNGYTLNEDQTVALISNTLSSKIAGVADEGRNYPIQSTDEKEIQLPVEIKKPNVSSDNIDNLGIKELIAKGTTNFAKSPQNRRHNISVGASFFNGMLIKPNEEFSFLQGLGDVSIARGFLPELVIKEDKTEPEVGGGLCQVSTTMFRAALNAGLKITDRTNHKYRVSYYEPPIGLDATVYIPSPDLKFINDTPGHILIQSKVSGNEITFEFYGTKDGREVSISEPVKYDAVEPGETRYIDDPNMEPGTEQYLEKAHAGIKAKIEYIVKRNNEVINKQTFLSKYVAWPAVIKRGPVIPEDQQPQQ